MPRQRAVKPQISFFRGLQTEASPLNYPEDFFEDGDNIELDANALVSRRLGVNAETAYQLSSPVSKGLVDDYEILELVWESPGGDSGENFYVLRYGNIIHFYDNNQSPRSSFKKSFTVNLDVFLVSGTSTSVNQPVTMAAGFRRLFVTGDKIEPFYITYNPDTGTITTTQANIQVRDIEDLDDGFAIDEEPTSLSAAHEYNMRNRGWVKPSSSGTDPYTTYFSNEGTYPSKNKQWWAAKDTNDNFDSSALDKFFTGSTSAPKGHYLINPFNIDRSSISGVAGLDTVVINERPKAVAFFAGRVFWAYKNTIYFNRTILSDEDIGKCYQDFDPTSEDASDLLADDGGTIPVLAADDIVAMKQFGAFLIIYANNGIWALSGADGIFRATEYSVTRITKTSLSSVNSLVEAEGIQYFWGIDGIYSLTVESIAQNPGVTNVSLQSINTFYNDISTFSKEKVKGVYDRYNKRIRWIYTSATAAPANDILDFDRMLTYDLRLQAFIPSSFPKLSGSSSYPAIVGISELSTLTAFTETEQIVVGGDNVQVDGDNVVVLRNSEESDEFIGVKFLILTESGTNAQYTFGELSDTTFKDFRFVDDTGVNYSSYLVPGDERLGDLTTYKQAPYITVFSKRTETAFVDNGDGTYDFDRPSSILMKVFWDWSDTNGRVSSQQQCYRFPRNYVVDTGDLTFNQGHDIIVTRNKVRGKGRTLSLRFESEEGKDFQIYGWTLVVDSNASF